MASYCLFTLCYFHKILSFTTALPLTLFDSSKVGAQKLHAVFKKSLYYSLHAHILRCHKRSLNVQMSKLILQ